MSDTTPLLAAIRAAPDDDAPRLVYADWLDEQDQPERAEFIRVQVELARKATASLFHREAFLITKHHDALAGELAAPGLQFRFHRGFAVAFGHAGSYIWSGGAFYSSLRFFPDGTTIQTSGSSGQEDISSSGLQTILPGHPIGLSGQYDLEGYSYPAGLRFSIDAADGTTDYHGVLEHTAVHLDVHKRNTGRHIRQRFVLTLYT